MHSDMSANKQVKIFHELKPAVSVSTPTPSTGVAADRAVWHSSLALPLSSRLPEGSVVAFTLMDGYAAQLMTRRHPSCLDRRTYTLSPSISLSLYVIFLRSTPRPRLPWPTSVSLWSCFFISCRVTDTGPQSHGAGTPDPPTSGPS